MTYYQAKIVLQDSILEMPIRSTWIEAFQDKLDLNKEYDGFYLEQAKIYTCEM